MKYSYSAKVVEVCDGGTFIAVVDLGFAVQKKIKFVLFGIVAPEIARWTKNSGEAARSYLANLIQDKVVTIESTKTGDQYSAVVKLEDVDINQAMIQSRLVCRS